MTQLAQYQRFTATFQPLRTDDLQPGLEGLIGWRGEWMVAWVIEDGPYEGDWACTPTLHQDTPVAFGWAPLCDLELEPGWLEHATVGPSGVELEH